MGDGAAGTEVFLGLATYLVALVVIGLWTSRRIHRMDDFLLGGRKLGPWVTAISERASGESSWFLMGLPGAAYVTGFFEFWSVIGIAFGILVSWLVIALPLRRSSDELGALTLPEYLARRFPERRRPILFTAALASLVFYLAYLGAQILGAGKIFQSLLGWNFASGALLGAVIVAGYTLLGGFLAVAWTDLLQGLLMAMVTVVLPILVLARLGWNGILEGLQAARPESFFAMGRFGLSAEGAAAAGADLLAGFGFGAIIGGLAWGLGYLGQPHLLTRYMAIERPEALKRSTGIAMGWVLLAYWGVTLAGIFAVPIIGPEIADKELVLLELARELLPAWFAGFVIAGILAAIMSTADSQLLVVTSAVVEDFGVDFFGLKRSPRDVVRITRLAILLITAIALAPVVWEGGQKMVYGIVAYAWTGLGSTFGPAVILTLWWKRVSATGCLAGMLTGTVMTIVWSNVEILQKVLDLKVGPFLCACAAVVVVSLLVPARMQGAPAGHTR